jgi:hypothetical protein
MRRIVLITLVFMILNFPTVVHADDSIQNYHSDDLGLALQYPAGWKLREQATSQTITTALASDLDLIDSGKAPQGLLFTISVTSFRQLGASTPDDFPAILKQITASPDATPSAIRIGGADGQFVDTQNTAQDVAARTAILSIGRRRVAVVRGAATIDAWMNTGESQFNDLTSHLTFFIPPNRPDQDSVSRVLWQLPATQLSDLADITLNLDGSIVYVADHRGGVWTVTTNGVGGDIYKPTDIGDFAGISTRADGSEIVSDPANHALWQITPATKTTPQSVRKFAGSAGTKPGQFGDTYPRPFTFGAQGVTYAIDKTDKGSRIEIFDRGGIVLNTWDLDKLAGKALDDPKIATDDNGLIYVIAKNYEGILKINVSGALMKGDIGKNALAGIAPQAIAIDRYNNFYIATPDQGILKLDKDGNLQGVIGEAYDEANAPKPPQLGNPVAMTIEPINNLMYVVDAGRFPQVIAFALNGNTMVNRTAGTKTGGTLVYNSTSNGSIDASTFIYTYTFDGKVGDVVTVTMKADTDSKIDSYVELDGPLGTKLAANDDAKSSDLGKLDAQIKDYRLPVTGTYTIVASRFGAETTSDSGAFILSLDVKDKK